jgi:hypothetical protein
MGMNAEIREVLKTMKLLAFFDEVVAKNTKGQDVVWKKSEPKFNN